MSPSCTDHSMSTPSRRRWILVVVSSASALVALIGLATINLFSSSSRPEVMNRAHKPILNIFAFCEDGLHSLLPVVGICLDSRPVLWGRGTGRRGSANAENLTTHIVTGVPAGHWQADVTRTERRRRMHGRRRSSHESALPRPIPRPLQRLHHDTYKLSCHIHIYSSLRLLKRLEHNTEKHTTSSHMHKYTSLAGRRLASADVAPEAIWRALAPPCTRKRARAESPHFAGTRKRASALVSCRPRTPARSNRR